MDTTENKKSWKKRILKLVYLIVIIIILLPVCGLAYLSLTSPKLAIPGVVDGKLPLCPKSPNCVCSFNEDEKHAIEPIRFQGNPEEAFIKLQEKIKKLPRVKKIPLTKEVSAEGKYLHYEFTSLIFRYVDDVEFLLESEENLIHVRSASRAGHSDLNANRERIEKIRKLLK
jgi:uncharacterized protein (DUF1499 family)